MLHACYSHVNVHVMYMVHTTYWESFTEENIHEFHGFWNDRECFLATTFDLLIILTKNVHCR